MDRALDPELLRQALGESPPQNLPSVEELLQLLTQAELALLLQRPGQTEELTGIGWYLHGIASSRYALRIYGVERHRAAFKVAGHIFDLLSRTPDLNRFERFKYTFAAQIAYVRSELDPNALATYNRTVNPTFDPSNFTVDFQQLSLAVGIAFLGFDLGFVFDTAERVQSIVNRLENEWEVQTIFNTPFGASYGVIRGARNLLSFLVYGNTGSLERSRLMFRQAINAEASLEDHTSRWVAAHLLNLADGMESNSVWTALPPEVSPHVRRGFTMGIPRVLTLWLPQLELFRSGNNPLSEETKRLFLSTPTSGGKTLLAQLLIVSHLESQPTHVCYVAPTRSLCREVRRTLAKRLSFIDAQVETIPEWTQAEMSEEGQPEVEVMTPERLAYLLRTASTETLSRFGMFVFDEVHLVGEKGRGWTLEESLTYIMHATQHTHHKIALISAVVGNRNHFIQWISTDDQQPRYSHSDWRGPRRINAIYSLAPDWQDGTDMETRSKRFSHRTSYPQFGRLDVRISHTGDIHNLKTQEEVGRLVVNYEHRRARRGTRDTGLSTPFYQSLVPIIEYLSTAGSVLVVESTKPKAVQLAKTIAEKQEEIDVTPIQHVLDLVEARLTYNHPLYRLLQHGVAYHHGSLPDEIRVAIEEIVADGLLNILVATTTMTEGVNLPVRSVVIASQGSHGVDGYVEYITGPKLVNAIGRAGRAAKETEGIVVLAWNQRLEDTVIERLSPDDTQMQVESMLKSAEALQELAAFEAKQREFEDAIFEIEPGAISEFLKFVWFIMAQREQANQLSDSDHIHEVLQRTLGWTQLEENDRERWEAVADMVVERYYRANERSRRRWARSGTSLKSARQLEKLAQEVSEALSTVPMPQTVADTIDLIFSDGRLEKIMALPEFLQKDVYERRGGGHRQPIDIPLDQILNDWVSGQSLVQLGDTYLSAVNDIEFRFEQLGDFINNYFEVRLPWIFSTLISWTNEFLSDAGFLQSLSVDIPAYIRWGVNNSVAVELLNRGILSRRLALRIASEWKPEVSSADVYHWIRSMELAEWQERFNPSTAELRSLLDYSRQRRGGVAAELIRQESVQIEVTTQYEDYPEIEVEIRVIDHSHIAQLAIMHGTERVGVVRNRDQRDVQDILNMGIMIAVTFHAIKGRGIVEIQIIPTD